MTDQPQGIHVSYPRPIIEDVERNIKFLTDMLERLQPPDNFTEKQMYNFEIARGYTILALEEATLWANKLLKV